MANEYRTGAANKNARGPVKPLLIGLMLGLVIGIAIAAGVAIYVARIPSPYSQNPQGDPQKPKQPVTIDTKPADPPAAKDVAKPEEKKPYTFYDILEGNKTPNPDKPATAKTPSRVEPSATGDDKTVFYVQAGSYQTEADADNQKATIALLGFEARVRSATLPDKGTVYRVRLGPFKSQEEATQAKTALQDNGITANLVKIVKNAPTSGVN
jgi:cell division protein FtsN